MISIIDSPTSICWIERIRSVLMPALVIFTNDRVVTFLLWEIFFLYIFNSIKNRKISFPFIKKVKKKKRSRVVESIYNIV